jgi:hypothetical protein
MTIGAGSLDEYLDGFYLVGSYLVITSVLSKLHAMANDKDQQPEEI